VPTGSCKLCDPSGYRTLSGTSMATPHVSGTGALLMSRGLTNLDARTQISGTATDLGSPGFDLFYGWGRVDALAATTKTPYFPPTGDTTPPNVAFVSPSDGFVITTNTVTVKVEAADDLKLETIDLRVFWGDSTIWTRLATTNRSPLAYKWRTDQFAPNTYTLEARALDAAGNEAFTRIIVIKP